MSGETPPALLLASASPVRGRLLRAAGVPFETVPAAIDEAAIRERLRAEAAPATRAAEVLAEAKALQVSARRSDALVIGADQILESDRVWLEKPADRERARRDLLRLRGRAHHQVSAVCLARDGARSWCHVESVRLVVRPFSEAFLERYLESAGSEVLACPGAYQLEGLGAQLFTAIEGDYFSVLGLPLLPLLEALRGHGVLVP